jgi:hypothetical protein
MICTDLRAQQLQGITTSLAEERLCLYLHQVFRSDDIGADQRVGRQDAPEAPANSRGPVQPVSN